VRSYLPSLELVVADLAGPELTREALRASDAEPVSETLLEILQGASGPEASALFDEWTARLRPLQGEPAGGSTLCAVLCYLTHVSAIPRPRISAAAEALPEPEKETFMTAAQEWMLEGLEKGLQQGRQEGRQEGERAALESTLTRLVRLRFREMPNHLNARIEAATTLELERWIERILTAETLDDLFA
jgi:flagellar biosynthesis/type III secretory pathway protein FliH